MEQTKYILRENVVVVADKGESEATPTKRMKGGWGAAFGGAGGGAVSSSALTPSTRLFETKPSSIPVSYGPINKFYELKEKVGRGAFSVVYRAVEIAPPKRIVAVKILDFNLFQSEPERHRQQRILEGEIEILDLIEQKLGSHPNLARVFGIVRDRESLRVGIAMELLSGGELFDRIVKRTKYSEKDAAQLMRSIMIGLKGLHGIGLVHCDLKPENLIFSDPSETAQVKITDFGLSKILGKEDMHAGALVGTAQYVSPESLNKREYTQASDVWSMGVVLYILLCGYPPFYGNNNTETFQAIKRGKFEFHTKYWGHVSAEAKALVLRMLQMDPAERCTVQQVLDDPWMKGQLEHSEFPLEVLDNLRKFNAKRKLKAAAMAVMIGSRFGLKKRLVEIVEKSPITNFNLEQLAKMKESFKKYATADNRVTRDGFAKALGELGFAANALPTDTLFRLFDSSGEGSISYRAFLTHMSTLKDNSDESIKFCFDIYDENGDGCLTKEELSSVLRNLLSSDPKYSGDDTSKEDAITQQIEDIFARLDSDGNGTIDFQEFKNGITKDKILIQHFVQPIQDLT
jgi:calcium-dependent protein kinase